MRFLFVLLAFIPSFSWADHESFVDLAPELLGTSQQSFLLNNNGFACRSISPTVQLKICTSTKETYLGRRWDLAYATFSNGKLVGIELILKGLKSLPSSDTFRELVYALTTQFGMPLKVASNVDVDLVSEAVWQPGGRALLQLALRQAASRSDLELNLRLVSARWVQEPLTPAILLRN